MHDTFGGVREDEVEDIQKVSVFNLGSYWKESSCSYLQSIDAEAWVAPWYCSLNPCLAKINHYFL